MKKTLLSIFWTILWFFGSASGSTKPINAIFTENKGQVHDQNFQPRPDVLFGGTLNGLTYHLRKNGVSYQLERVNSWMEDNRSDISPGTVSASRSEKVANEVSVYRIDINWPGINPEYNVETAGKQTDYCNYYIADCVGGIKNVRTYKEVTYRNIYNSIDLRYYEHDGHLKYDYIVAPYGDYKKIQLEINGAKQIELQSDGSLILKTPLGNIREGAPLVYQENIRVTARWLIKGNTISFEIDNYNPGKQLIIDPLTRLWGTYYGGTAYDNVTSVTTDASLNVLACGNTNGATGTIVATVGSYLNTFAGSSDAFLVKFNSAGIRQWATYYGGSGADYGNSCKVDQQGNIYLAGRTTSTVGIASTLAYQTALGNTNGNMFLAKFDQAGNRVWATYYCGVFNSVNSALCAVDPSGNPYLAGTVLKQTGTAAASASDIATQGSHQPGTGTGVTLSFLVKFNSSGVRQWGTFYGDTTTPSYGESAWGLATDLNGNVFMCGSTVPQTAAGIIATSGAFQSTFGGGLYDAYLVKFNSNGVRQWGTYYGGASHDIGYSCWVDSIGAVYLGGSTYSSNNISTPGSHQATFGGGSTDGFMARFTPSGARRWATYYGGTGNDAIGYVNGYNSKRIYLAGSMASTNGNSISTPGSYQSAYGGGGTDAAIAEFDSLGVRQWGSYYGDSGDDQAGQIVTDIVGNIYLAGLTGTTSTLSGTVIASAGSHQSTFGGNFDGFLVKFSNCTPLALSANPSTPLCLGGSATITASGANSYTWSNGSVSNLIVVTPTVSGSFSVTGTTAAGCNASDLISITVQTPTISIISSTGSNGICPGGSLISLAGAGANSYTWTPAISNGVPFLATAASGYTLAGTNACGVSTTAITLTLAPSPTISASSSTPSVCKGSTITVTGSGGLNYFWSGGVSNNVAFQPLASSIYTVTGTDLNGCTGSATINIAVLAQPTVAANSNSPAICSGNSTSLFGSGALTYTWTGGVTNNVVFTPTGTASYTVTGSGANSCTNSAVKTITVNSLPLVAANATGTLICAGDQITLYGSGASSYTWTGGAINGSTFGPAVTTTFNVTGSNSYGCQGTASIAIVVNPLPQVVASPASTAVCAGGYVTLTGNGSATTYTWTGGVVNAAPFAPLISASYTLTGVDANGCKNYDVASVQVNSNPVISIVASNTQVCSGQSVTFNGSGAINYNWSGGLLNGVAFNPVASGGYTVIGTDVNNCQGTASVYVLVNPSPTLTATQSNSLICAGQSSTLTVNGSFNYAWNTNGTPYVYITANQIAVSPTVTTSYTVTGIDPNNCADDIVITQIVNKCDGLWAGDSKPVRIFPNPSKGRFTISATGDIELYLIAETGQIVKVISCSQGNDYEVEVEGLAEGLYFLLGNKPLNVVREKVVITK
jgi:hypothetical protein